MYDLPRCRGRTITTYVGLEMDSKAGLAQADRPLLDLKSVAALLTQCPGPFASNAR